MKKINKPVDYNSILLWQIISKLAGRDFKELRLN